MAEEWRDVVGWEGRFQVSSLGRFKRLPQYRSTGNGKALLPEKISYGFNNNGYRVVYLPVKTKQYLHRLVCEAFHGPAPEGKNNVAHFDGDKANNKIENLRWTDWADNAQDAKRLGEHAKGAGLPQTILTEDEVREIRALHQRGEVSMRGIGRRYQICHQHVGDIVRRKIWKHV